MLEQDARQTKINGESVTRAPHHIQSVQVSTKKKKIGGKEKNGGEKK